MGTAHVNPLLLNIQCIKIVINLFYFPEHLLPWVKVL